MMAAPMMRPSAMRKAILRKGSPSVEPADGDEVRDQRPEDEPGGDGRDADARADEHARAQRRGGQLDRARGSATLPAAMPPTMPAGDAAAELGDGLAQQHRVGERAQDVGHREARGVGELHAVHEHRRVEHAHAHAEHADAEHVEDQLPDGRLRQPHPHHRLDEHAHGAHARDRGRRRLHVVRAVLALGAVAEGDGGAEDAREHLAAHEEAEREVHVGRGDAAQRARARRCPGRRGARGTSRCRRREARTSAGRRRGR